MRTAKVRGCGSLCSLQFINSLPASATTAAAIPASACINSTQPPHPHLSLVMRAVSGHVFTLDCSRQRCTVPARSVYLDVQYDDEIPDTIQPVHTMPQLVCGHCSLSCHPELQYPGHFSQSKILGLVATQFREFGITKKSYISTCITLAIS